MIDTLQSIEQRYKQLTELLAQPEVALNPAELQQYAREHAQLEAVVERFQAYQAVLRDLEAAKELLAEQDGAEARELAESEVIALERERDSLLQDLQQSLVPADRDEERDCVVEIRAGTGGEEAALFAADLYRMYARYAERQKWQTDLVDASLTGRGGMKEVIFEVHGRSAYSRLRRESGVHRVQRVPVTEASGRIHTSAATVAVLPEVEEVDIQIDPDELRVDIFHAGGHGGQNVNKVATAVRIIHLPTGIVAVCQDERSQLRNRQKAMAVLRARLYDMEQRKQAAAVDAARRAQVGTGERSEKIRTYNFPQDRVTDHRIGLTLHHLEGILDGELEPLIEPLRKADLQARLRAAGFEAFDAANVR